MPSVFVILVFAKQLEKYPYHLETENHFGYSVYVHLHI